MARREGSRDGRASGSPLRHRRCPRDVPEEQEAGTRRTMKGFGRIYRRGAICWIEYWHRGQQFRESSGSGREGVAAKLLKKRLQEIGRGRFVGPSEERVLLTDLLDGLTVDYELNGRRSLKTLKFYVAA